MSDREIDKPIGVYTDVPNSARMYSYYLGGKNWFRADKEAAEKMIEVNPGVRAMARANRDFLRWAVADAMATHGIRQFLDLGSGLPEEGNVHEVAHEIDPAARVVYSDIDEIVLVHARALLTSSPNVAVGKADIADLDQVFGMPELELLDLSQPVGLLMISVLHFVPGDLTALMAGYRDAVAPGSTLAISHGTGTRQALDRIVQAHADTEQPPTARTPEQVEALLDGWQITGGPARVEAFRDGRVRLAAPHESASLWLAGATAVKPHPTEPTVIKPGER